MDIERYLAPLRRRMRLMVSRAVVRLVNDTTKTQALQVEILKGELYDRIERLQNYGITSVPLPGAEAIVLAAGGDRAHGVVVVVGDKRYRLTGLEPGEVAIHDDQGQKVHLTREGIVVDGGGVGPITFTNAEKAVFEMPVEIENTLTMTGAGAAGNITTPGTVTATTDVVGGGKSMIGHKHGGVSPGGGQTGVAV